MYHLGQDPDAWAMLKAQPDLATNAAHEAIQIGTPIRSFARHASKNVDIAGVEISKGARVMMLYASANRDEQVFEHADQFDLTRRNARRHLAFGALVHMCVGMHLAVLEIECLLTAMIDHFELGTPTVAMNNSICAYASWPIRIND